MSDVQPFAQIAVEKYNNRLPRAMSQLLQFYLAVNPIMNKSDWL